jgi:phage terminase large subunit-like protein
MSDWSRDYAALANRYAREAVRDKRGRRFCKFVRLAAQRHLDDLKRKDWEFTFDPEHGNNVCDFIEKLPHVEGIWETPTLTLEPAQIFILVVVFGWRRKQTGTRRFTRVYIEMARKNAKSTLTAGIALYCLCCEKEVGPQIIIGATTGDQARKVFDPAKKIVERTADLRSAFGVQAWARSITCQESGGYIQTINSKSSTQDGWNPHLGILDELHAHKDRGLFDVVRSAFGARKNPLLWTITTAGYNLAGVCYEQRVLVGKILEGTVEADHYFGIVFTLDEGDDVYDERTWIKANPLLGVAVQLEELRGCAVEARNSPDSEGEFKTKRLNIWLGAACAWLSLAKWQTCTDTGLSWEDFDGRECFIGADLADKDDLCALTLVSRDNDDCVIVKSLFVCPDAKIRNIRDEVAPYDAWAQAGHIQTHEGDWIDHGRVEAQIREWMARYNVQAVVFDQFAAARQMSVSLNEDAAGEFSHTLVSPADNITSERGHIAVLGTVQWTA